MRLTAALLLALASGSCMRATATAEGAPLGAASLEPPKLIVFITVDQLRGDMLDRYRPDMQHGYARLMQGAWFTRGYQDHAITETAPGHASTLSGRFPRSTGIMSNSAGVVDPAVSLVVGSPNEPGASPGRFLGTTLFDWLSAKNRRTRALSVSRKDRSAILPIGKAKQDVYWYSSTGNFTTSTYYRDALPDWVQAFNAKRIPHSYAGKGWTLLKPESSYAEPDSVPFENGGRNFVFPYNFSDDSSRAAAQIANTPMHDEVIARFALHGLESLDLGRGSHTDLLAVSFSATDAVGHTWGPDSREAHDNQMRLDVTLGWFLDSLYKLRDPSTVVVALTGDHGVQPNPRLARQRGEATGDQGLVVSLRDQVNSVRSALAAQGVDSLAFDYDMQLVWLDRSAVAAKGLKADSILDAFAAAARAVPGVARVDRMAALRRADPALDPVARRWVHQIAEGAPVDFVITLTKYSLWYNATATHGSPYDQDAHVPIIFLGPRVAPGRYDMFARVVDMAPTLAAIAGATPLEKVDGLVLTSALRR
jgi:predicted AlkP superfamily pyrophosphatase or phosphodiesterase